MADERRKPRGNAGPKEASERDLAGGGATQLSATAAMRARELNRPTEEDLAEAERDVVIVRRNWKPPPS